MSPGRFSCIGDVIGDPFGALGMGNEGNTNLIHEFMCIHWASTFCDNKIAGNRDINKLRFLQEIPQVLGGHYVNFPSAIAQYQSEFINGDKKNEMLLKQILGHVCYPYTIKNEQKISKHYENMQNPPLPFQPVADLPFKAPIWERFP